MTSFPPLQSHIWAILRHRSPLSITQTVKLCEFECHEPSQIFPSTAKPSPSLFPSLLQRLRGKWHGHLSKYTHRTRQRACQHPHLTVQDRRSNVVGSWFRFCLWNLIFRHDNTAVCISDIFIFNLMHPKPWQRSQQWFVLLGRAIITATM